MTSPNFERLNIAFVGHGAIAEEHLAVLLELGCKVSLVIGENNDDAQSFALRHDIPRWSADISAIAGDSIDAVIVTTPNDLHAEQTIDVARMRKHVLCEVPLATSFGQAKRVADEVSRAGIICSTCQTRRFEPSVSHLRDLVEQEALDPLFLISITGLRRRSDENIGWSGVPRRWLDSVIWHHGSHAIDTALFLMREPIADIKASTGRPDKNSQLPLEISVAIRLVSGRLANVAISYSALRPLSELILIAESGTFTTDFADGILRDASGSHRTRYSSAPGLRTAIKLQDEHFLRSVLGTVAPSATPTELLPLFQALEDVNGQVMAQLTDLGPFL
jgi:2-hydroxy-4-carboxymuconate semialdehyde hemiacetal dehydrogenase